MTKVVDNIKDTLITECSEVWINGDCYTGYVLSISDTDITIENYDLEHETIKISDIDTLRNRDENICFKK